MKNDCGITKLSDADLFQEHDLLKTILFKSQYSEPDEETQVHYDDFNNLSYFPHLSPDLDLNRIELILNRLKPYKIINTKDQVARYDSGTYFFQINKTKLEELVGIMEEEVKERSTNAKTKKIEFERETGKTKYFVNGRLSGMDTFNPITNEYKILNYFLLNNNRKINYQELIGELKKPRMTAEGADNKRRVKDVIDAIEKKLSKNVIEKVANGIYIFNGEVTHP